MNNKFLTDYLVIFTNSQNDLLEVILNNKGYNKIPILKETSEIVSKLASCTYSILYELNISSKGQHQNIKELEEIRKNILRKDSFKLIDKRIKEKLQTNLYYARTLDLLLLNYLPEIDNTNYGLVNEIIDIYEILNNLFD
jgi:hypothetical protein